MKSTVLGVAFALAVAVLSATAPVHAGSTEDLQAALAALQRQDFETVERNAESAIKAGDLKGDHLATAHFLRGYARLERRNAKDAIDDLTEALGHTQKGGNIWVSATQMRMLAYLNLGRTEEGAKTFVTLAAERPAAARMLRSRLLFRMIWELERKDEAQTFEVLKALRDISYVPDEPGVSVDYMTKVFVRLLAQKGDDMVAMLELSKIRTADLLIEARIDKRYAALWTKKDFDTITDPKEIAVRELTYAGELAQRQPNLPLIVMRYAKALRASGDSAKAVTVAREALANPELKSANAERDVEDKLWLRNELVYALKDTGRTDEMFAEMQPALKLDETKNPAVVNQLINFGQIMTELDRGAEGVKTAQRARDLSSPLGKMFVLMVEVCASATTDQPAAEKSLGLLRKGQSENYAAMTAALLCMNRTDDVADLVKKRLSISAERGAVLAAVQNYNAPAFVTPMRRLMLERYAKVIARSDVQAAIKKHGRIETFPFAASYWGSL